MNPATSPGDQASSLYGATLWRAGTFLARALPTTLSMLIAKLMSGAYQASNRQRAEVVTRNLLPPLDGDLDAAKRMTRRLFHQFSRKLVDLWKYEAGEPITPLFTQHVGWENFEEAQRRGRGILLLTIHVGNWEFGAPLLKEKGVDIEVITLAEPDPKLTRLREEARARWGIPTLVIGQDQFAFVDVIRRLNDGATIALLMDRPPASTGVEVEMFGQPFLASISAAELARASGCSLVPAYLPRGESGYAAHILPLVDYDRALLQGKETRRILTQKVMRLFEPVIRGHLDQWYHFVPIWPQGIREP